MRAVHAPRLSALQWALTLSVALHAALLGLRFGAPRAFERVFEDTPLAVVLVNRSSADPADRPQALAQANLAGGGNELAGLATTPLPASPEQTDGDAVDDQSRALAQQEAKERELVTSVRSQIVQLQRIAASVTQPQAAQALQDQRRRLLDLLGAIERSINEQNAGPRRRFVGPNTRSVPYAMYYDRMRQKIEYQGTLDFPQQHGQKLYGKLIMAITVDAAGRLLQTEIVHGSGDPLLDRLARAIVEAAQPFGHFSAAMRDDADQIVIVAGFDFTRDSGLETMLQSQPDGAPPAAR
jgi:protein TonB